jgi:hypothetical protein
LVAISGELIGVFSFAPVLIHAKRYDEAELLGIQATTDGGRLKLFVFRIEVEVVDHGGEMLGRLPVAFDEGAVDDQIGGGVGKLLLPPLLGLPPHGLEVALHAVHADGESVMQREFLECLASTGVNTMGQCDNVLEFTQRSPRERVLSIVEVSGVYRECKMPLDEGCFTAGSAAIFSAASSAATNLFTIDFQHSGGGLTPRS